jgi:hypothetical protein
MTTLAGTHRDALAPRTWNQTPTIDLVPLAQRPTRVELASQRATTLELPPCPAILVPGIGREIEVKVASERSEWEEAYQLVAQNYKSRGYEPADARGLRFTAFHALPDTTTFVAKHAGHVVATLSLVVDNTLLGLPMECIYGPEIHALRTEGRRLGEVTSLADTGLGVREFLQVFVTMIKLMVHYHTSHGGDTCVISVNPRHRAFYSKVIGFAPLGPCRSYPSVQDAPAEAYVVNLQQMKANAPKMYQEIQSEVPHPAQLTPRPMPAHLVRYFGSHSTQTSLQGVQEILDYVAVFGSPRRWA